MNIMQADPVEDWSKKYTSDGTIQLFTIEEIATCGSQVLQVNKVFLQVLLGV